MGYINRINELIASKMLEKGYDNTRQLSEEDIMEIKENIRKDIEKEFNELKKK